LPRRYRPPTRRRRPRKPNLPGQPAQPEPSSPSDAEALPEAELDEGAETEAPPYEEEEDADEAAYEPEPVPVVRRHEVRHVMVRDHSHVIADLQRIVFIVAFIMGGIIITAILR
jgi:hypothetical protein